VLCGRPKVERRAGRGYSGGLLPCSLGRSSMMEPLKEVLGVLGVSWYLAVSSGIFTSESL
jgi:hypothetical protein